MKKEEKCTPHIIAAAAFVVFIVLGLACASSSNVTSETPLKLFEPRQFTVNIPGIGPVQGQEMLVHVDYEGIKYFLIKTPIPGAEGLFEYSISLDAYGTDRFNDIRRFISIVVASRNSSLRRMYAVPDGPFKLIIDGETYYRGDYSEFTVDTYVVYGKVASLGEARDAILKCSQLSIAELSYDGEEISPYGIAAIKNFLRLTPEEAVLNALQTLEETGGDFRIEPINGGTSARITYYMGSNQTVHIPPKISGLPVTNIGGGAFYKKNLISVIIPDSVTSIGEYAFTFNQLTRIIIPDSVTSIGEMAFYENPLINVTIGRNVVLAGNHNRVVIDGNFAGVYRRSGYAAGIYTRPNASVTEWTKQ